MLWAWLSIGAGLFVALGIVIVGFAIRPDRTKWHVHETARGPVMRRRVWPDDLTSEWDRQNKKWETRPMTDEEMEDYRASRAGW